MKSWLDTFKYVGGREHGEQHISSWEKIIEGECRIIYETHENNWGGKSIITVEPLPIMERTEKIWHLRPPVLEFFATGFDELEALEKKIREEIVPILKQWAIKTI